MSVTNRDSWCHRVRRKAFNLLYKEKLWVKNVFAETFMTETKNTMHLFTCKSRALVKYMLELQIIKYNLASKRQQ